jgi:hypothetical protein
VSGLRVKWLSVTFIGAGALRDLRRSYADAWGTEVDIQNTNIKKIGKEISGPRIKIVDIHNCPSPFDSSLCRHNFCATRWGNCGAGLASRPGWRRHTVPPDVRKSVKRRFVSPAILVTRAGRAPSCAAVVCFVEINCGNVTPLHYGIIFSFTVSAKMSST